MLEGEPGLMFCLTNVVSINSFSKNRDMCNLLVGLDLGVMTEILRPVNFPSLAWLVVWEVP